MWKLLLGILGTLIILILIIKLFFKKSLRKSNLFEEGVYKKELINSENEGIILGSKKKIGKESGEKIEGFLSKMIKRIKGLFGKDDKETEKNNEERDENVEEKIRTRIRKINPAEKNQSQIRGNKKKSSNYPPKRKSPQKENRIKSSYKRGVSGGTIGKTESKEGDENQEISTVKRVFSPGSKIKISNESDIMKNLENPKLKKLFGILKLKNIVLFKEIDKLFQNKREFEEFLIEKTMDYLKERYEALKTDLSKLRKKGASVKILEIEILSITPKIKMFKATLDDKDFERVLNIFEKLEKEAIEIAEKWKINMEE